MVDAGGLVQKSVATALDCHTVSRHAPIVCARCGNWRSRVAGRFLSTVLREFECERIHCESTAQSAYESFFTYWEQAKTVS